jgi:hypothetical protein
VSRAQINLRLPSTLLDRLAASAQRQGISRNALVLRYVQEGLDLDDDTNRRLSLQSQYEKAGPERQSDKPHRHHFEKVPQTEAPGRLLGETEATYECVCGKSERRKVT